MTNAVKRENKIEKRPFLALPNKAELAFRGKVPNIDYGTLQKICRMKIKDFHLFGEKFEVPDGKKYFFKDNNADILFVGHLDSVQPFMHFRVPKLCYDTLIMCPNLDDRLGVYLGLKYFPALGLKYDILLTEDEEKGESTAAWFTPPIDKKYKWMFSFDRRGTGCVMYEYDSPECRAALEEVGFKVDRGSCSDIRYLERLGCKGFNFGAGYQNEHSMAAYASKKDLMMQIRSFLKFYQNNKNRTMPHTPKYNTFTLIDGFSYDASIKSEDFTLDEISFGEDLFNESINGKTTFSANQYVSKMYKEDLRRLMHSRQGEPCKIVNLPETNRLSNSEKPRKGYGSEDKIEITEFTPKMGIAIVHHPDISPDTSAVELAKKVQQNAGVTAVIVDHCQICGCEYPIDQGQILNLCKKCRLESQSSDSKVQKIRDLSKPTVPVDVTKLEKVAEIKTKLQIVLKGVHRNYRPPEGERKVWQWQEEKPDKEVVKVGFEVT